MFSLVAPAMDSPGQTERILGQKRVWTQVSRQRQLLHGAQVLEYLKPDILGGLIKKKSHLAVPLIPAKAVNL